ncbi:type II toxin-antitoxin system RelE family toxin [Cryobacterium zhongshanensis]|uniref:Type II toxin-antitoxin system RelE/ParE family toxin n=1 Tax=Cryobacterium zhongshanensis TaxID=2928153 RepID=A0AA41UEQ7_9MICO|nr:type II toxin-antitoxin system RelE/ParE family toxin [Cryobacterium zhongshanensis]MCI4657698.1 type II toxin-antitoxin system RelE/ParE family toxin [Cryobacterium zhongshanensis]
MSYLIRLTPQAAKEVRKLDTTSARRIRSFLEDRLAHLDNPRALGKRLVNEDFWRYRVGDYRILAHINDDEIVILMVRVAHRRDVYEGLNG